MFGLTCRGRNASAVKVVGQSQLKPAASHGELSLRFRALGICAAALDSGLRSLKKERSPSSLQLTFVDLCRCHRVGRVSEVGANQEMQLLTSESSTSYNLLIGSSTGRRSRSARSSAAQSRACTVSIQVVSA